MADTKPTHSDGDKDEEATHAPSRKKVVKKVVSFIGRPGYTKQSYAMLISGGSRSPSRMQFKHIWAIASGAMESEKKVAEAKKTSYEHASSMTDSEAFEHYVKLFKHSEETLAKAVKIALIRRYFYFGAAVFLVLLKFNAIALLSLLSGLLNPTNSLAHAFSTISFGIGVIVFTLMGFAEAWRVEQINRRSLFPFIEMFEQPLKFFI